MIITADTITINRERLEHWQSDPSFDYNRELMTPDVDVMEWIYRMIMKMLGKFFGNEFAAKYTELFLILFFVAVILLLIWFIYKARPELFMRAKKRTSLEYTVEEDTIYGIDFESRIVHALSDGNYLEAIRLSYLQELKRLSYLNVIDWQPYKTPTEYIYEVKPEQGRTTFRQLTNLFLRVRYGNYEATRELYNQMKEYLEEMHKENP